MRSGVIVPVKAFPRAKQRLAGILTEGQRAELARWCAARVVAAAAPLTAHVVCDDTEVASWAESIGAVVIWCPGVGLNAAVERGVTVLAEGGYDMAVIAHGDLPLARRLDHVAATPPADADGHVAEVVVTTVPDHRYDGTNILALPTQFAGRFAFQYGHRSFPRHVREILRLGSAVRVLRDDELSHDLDTPDDLDDPRMGDVLQWLRTSPANRH